METIIPHHILPGTAREITCSGARRDGDDDDDDSVTDSTCSYGCVHTLDIRPKKGAVTGLVPALLG